MIAPDAGGGKRQPKARLDRHDAKPRSCGIMAGAITDSLMESYCCLIADKRVPSWNAT
jgi:hypothetical protein